MASERWGAGEAYEAFMGRWSRLVAARFVPLLPVGADADWVDIGCGTGALSSAVLALADPRSVVGIDPAEGFVEHLRAVVFDARFAGRVGVASALGLHDASADAAVSALVLNFLPDPVLALAEARRVVRPGGMVGGYVWDYARGMGILRAFWDAAVDLDESARAAAEGVRFDLCHPDPLTRALAAAGLADGHVEPIDAVARFESFEEYWRPFLGGQGPAGGYVTALDEPRRAALREHLHERLRGAADGSLEVPLRAWAFWGTA